MKFKFTFLSFVAGAIGLSGCGIVHDHYEYELESPSDTTEIRHYKSICVNHRNGAACEYVATNGTYLSDEIKDKYLKLGCNYGYEKACKLSENSFRSSSCNLKNDLNDCYTKVNIYWENYYTDGELRYSREKKDLIKFYGNVYEGLKFAKKGCDLGDDELCMEQGAFARELSLNYLDNPEYSDTNFYNEEAIKVKKAGFGNYTQDEISKLAFNSYKQLCDKNNYDACVELGEFIETHFGNDPYKLSDTVFAEIKTYFMKGCKLDPYTGCEKLADAYYKNGNKKMAKLYYEKGLRSSSSVVRENSKSGISRISSRILKSANEL